MNVRCLAEAKSINPIKNGLASRLDAVLGTGAAVAAVVGEALLAILREARAADSTDLGENWAWPGVNCH